MQNRFFSAAKDMTINFEAFIKAVKEKDMDRIDILLEAKKNGCQLDINNEKQKPGGNPLEVALGQHDFITAGKLIDAGAELCSSTYMWFEYGLQSPCGGYQNIRRDFVDVFAKDEEVIAFLKGIKENCTSKKMT